MDVGRLIRTRRLANGLTQTQLALRAGSTQAAISRLERGELSPTIETVERLLAVMGEQAEILVRRGELECDRQWLRALRNRPPAERMAQAIGWNRLAGQFLRAGAAARHERRKIPIDAAAILRALAAHGVGYIVIGGLAVQAHGHPRTTQDLDLVPEPTAENHARLVAALSELAARPVGARAPAPVSIPAAGVLELDTDAGGVDIHVAPPGASPYAALRSRALMLELDDGPVAVAGRDDLIAMKRASGRPIDRSDIIALTEP